MDGPLSWRIEQNGETKTIVLSGEITEQSDFRPLLTEEGSAISLDLAGIKKINSTGVREWIHFISDLGRPGRKIYLDRCSVPIVHQLNMISNFKGGGTVRSIFAPYFCADCERQQEQLVELGSGLKAEDLEREIPCPGCSESMEFDDLVEPYLELDRSERPGK